MTDIRPKLLNRFLDERRVTLKAGNFGNSHIYLSKIRDFFPQDTIGPSNRLEGTAKQVKLHVCCLERPVETDIAGDKMIFRKRFWSKFFDHHKLEVGDEIAIKRIAEYEYEVAPWIGYRTELEKPEQIVQIAIRRERYITQLSRREVWKRDNGKCRECGSDESLEFDHMIPVSKGGNSTTNNVQLLCLRCNRAKSTDI